MASESRCTDANVNKSSKMSRYCNRYNNNNNNNRHRSNTGSIGIVTILLFVCIGSFVAIKTISTTPGWFLLRRSSHDSTSSRTRRRLLSEDNTTNTNTTTPTGAVTDGGNGNFGTIPVVTWFCFWVDPEDCLSPLSNKEESPPPPPNPNTTIVSAAAQDDNVTQKQQHQPTNSSPSESPATEQTLAPSTGSPTPGQIKISPIPSISPTTTTVTESPSDRPPFWAPTTSIPSTWNPTYLPTWNPTVLPTTSPSSSSLAPVFINDHNPVDGFPRLKLYWEDGYYWQDETFERKWCIAYHFDDEKDCWYGQDKRPCNDYHLYLNWCRDWDERQRFDVMQLKDNNIVMIRLQTIDGNDDDSVIVDWCWSISGVFVVWEHCNNQNRRQQWIADTRSYRFQLRPATRPSSCVTTHHHPKPGEVLELVNCNQARRSDTSFWNLYW